MFDTSNGWLRGSAGNICLRHQMNGIEALQVICLRHKWMA